MSENQHDEFGEMVVETREQLGRAARRMLRDDHAAADVVQETYLRAWRALPGFRGEARRSTWLTAILHNTIRSYVGKRAAEAQPLAVVADDPLDPDPLVQPESWADFHGLRERVSRAITTLSPTLQSVARLELEGASHEAVASELGISTGAVKVRLHRARRRLREAIERDANAA